MQNQYIVISYRAFCASTGRIEAFEVSTDIEFLRMQAIDPAWSPIEIGKRLGLQFPADATNIAKRIDRAETH